MASDSSNIEAQSDRPADDIAPYDEIVFIDDSDRSRALEIIEEIHGAEIAERAAHLWDWKFTLNPFRRDSEGGMVGFRQDGRLMGCVLSIPFHFKTEAGIYKGAWPVDHVMSRKVKSKALLANSMQMCRKLVEGNDLCPGQPVIGLEKLWARAIKMKNVLVGDYHPYHAVFKIDSLLRNRYRVPGLVAVCAQVAWAILDGTRRFFRRIRIDRTVMFESVKEIPVEADELWDKVSQNIPQLAVRNRAYLEWRFLQIPYKDRYVVRIARREGRMVGFIVLKIEDAYGLRKALIVDVLADVKDREIWNALLEESIRWARSQRADILTCLEFSLPELDGLLESYFFMKDKKYMRFIHNTYVPELRKPQYFDRRRWFLTYADHDCELT